MAYYLLVLKRLSSSYLLSSSLRPLRAVSQPVSSLLSNTNAVREYRIHDRHVDGHVPYPSSEQIPLGSSGHPSHVNFTTREEKLKGSGGGIDGGSGDGIDGGSGGAGEKSGGEEDKSSFKNSSCEGETEEEKPEETLPRSAYVPDGMTNLIITAKIDPMKKNAVARGVLYDQNGKLLGSFSMNCGHVDRSVAGLMGLEEGLCLAKEKKAANLFLETNVDEVYERFKNRYGCVPVGMTNLTITAEIDPVKKTAVSRGVLYEHNGKLLGSFSMNCGHVDRSVAGLMGLKEGLRLAKEKKVGNLLLETNVEEVSRAFQEYEN